jgi:predicted RNA binding protein YcfA (HicA-like mRNA interferase family)
MNRRTMLSPRELIRALAKVGYEIDHQTGSHIILRNTLPPHRRLTIPNHREIARGTLKSILQQAGITSAQLDDLL